MSAIDDLERAVRDAEYAAGRATIARIEAERALQFARNDEAHAFAIRCAAETPTAHALAEYVADAAREHGSTCARAGRAETTEAWARFRVLLDALTRRAT